MKLKLAVCILTQTLLIVLGCRQVPPVSESEVVGTYLLRDVFGTDRVTPNQDGTFDETFTSSSGQVYRSSGQWTYEVTDGQPWVTLNKAMVVSFGEREPPNRLRWTLKARRSGEDVVLDWGDPDRIVILRKQDP